MPNYEKNSQKSDFVDISSNKQVKKLYNKKGRLKRILCLVFSIIFLLGGGGMLYYYSFLDTLNFKVPGKSGRILYLAQIAFRFCPS